MKYKQVRQQLPSQCINLAPARSDTTWWEYQAAYRQGLLYMQSQLVGRWWHLHSCCKCVNTTTAEKSCFFQHKIFFYLFKLAQFKKSGSPWDLIPPSLQSLIFMGNEAGAFVLLCVWVQCLDEILIIGKQPKWHQCSMANVWNADTCRQKASCHSRTGICPYLHPKNSFLCTAASPSRDWVQHDTKHEDPELSPHHETAAWVSCSLKTSSSGPVQGISHHPGGKLCILNLSKTSRD